jgi:hypothetical protein
VTSSSPVTVVTLPPGPNLEPDIDAFETTPSFLFGETPSLCWISGTSFLSSLTCYGKNKCGFATLSLYYSATLKVCDSRETNEGMPARNQETNFHVAKPQFEICSKSGLATSIMKSHSSGFRVPVWTFSSPEPPWVGFSGLTPSFGNSGTQSFRNRHHRELLPPSKI